MKQFVFILLAAAVRGSLSGPNVPSRRGWTTEWPNLDSSLSSEPERLPSTPEWCTCVDVRACPGARRLLRRDADQRSRRRLLGHVTCGFDGFMPFVCCNRLQDPEVGEEGAPHTRRRQGPQASSGTSAARDRSRPSQGPAKSSRERPGALLPGAEVSTPRPCRGHEVGDEDSNISPATYIGPAQTFPYPNFGRPSMHHHTPDTARLPASFDNFFGYDSRDYEGPANGQGGYQADSSRHSFPSGSVLDEEDDEALERSDHMFHHHLTHVLIPTIPTYKRTPRQPMPTGVFVIPMTPQVRKWRVTPTSNSDDYSKRRRASGNDRCGSTSDERGPEGGYSVRSDFPGANRNTPGYATGGTADPAIIFPTAQSASGREVSNTIPPEYVRGGDVVPSTSNPRRPASSSNNHTSQEAGHEPGSTVAAGASESTTWRQVSSDDGSSSSWSHKMRLLQEEECGVSVDERIVGGKSAALGAFPWIARLGYIRAGSRQVMYRCGGSLISRQHVVTAAHCVTKLPSRLQLVTVRLGELDERTDPDCNIAECADPVQDFVPKSITVHESYDRPKYKNDIAIIRLDRPVIISAYVSPICLPFDEFIKKNYTGESVIVAGWGSTGMGLPSSKTLQWVKLKVLPTAGCDAMFSRQAKVSVGEGQMCAAGDGGKDSCEGDSGGPLASLEQPTLHSMARHVLVGVVSFGAITCATDTVPGVYTDLTHYLRWLLDSIPASEL